MDLGIKGKWALVGGASKGLGWGCASALAQAGVNLVMVSRGAPALGLLLDPGVEVVRERVDLRGGAEVRLDVGEVTHLERVEDDEVEGKLGLLHRSNDCFCCVTTA